MNPAISPRAILRWSWLLVLATAVGAASAYGLSALMPEQYEAESVVLVGSLTVTDPDEQFGYRQLADTYAGLVPTPLILDDVIVSLGLDERASDLSKRVTASTPGGRNIIGVRARAASAEDAAGLAQSVATRLVEVSAGTAADGEGLAVIIESAEVPPSPSAPSMTLNVMVGAALGLMAGLLMVYLALGRRAVPVPDERSWGAQAPRPQPAPRPPAPPLRRS